MATTSRWGLRYPALDGSDVADVPLWMNRLATDLDGVAMDDQGLLSARPVSTAGTPGKRGRYYYATDSGQLFRDTGTSWVEIQVGSIDPAEPLRLAGPDARRHPGLDDPARLLDHRDVAVGP